MDVAQLVESWDVTPEGRGSKPLVHPNVVLDLYGGGGGCNPPVLWPAGFDSLTLHQLKQMELPRTNRSANDAPPVYALVALRA